MISLQSHTEVLNTLDSYPSIDVRRLEARVSDGLTNGHVQPGEDGKILVASVSPQVRASLAATYNISERQAGYMIEQFLSGPHGLRTGGKYGNGFTWVVDTNVMREACLVLGADEVANSSQSPDPSSATPKRPILTSACPGWICYAEKTHPHVLPHLSRLKSPQALTGTFLKSVLSKTLNISPSQIWHLALMPCFDKKLEASREELTDLSWQSTTPSEQSPIRDVDCVITTRELLILASTRSIPLQSLPLCPVTYPPFPSPTFSSFLFPRHRRKQSLQGGESGPSGGYLQHILLSHKRENPDSTIQSTRGRNADVIEYTLLSPAGTTILKAGRYYGFRNIQNLVRKLKPARTSRLPGASRKPGAQAKSVSGNATDYAYVEVMACPGGCTNGGGQIRVDDLPDIRGDTTSQPNGVGVNGMKPGVQEQKEWLARVDEAYFSGYSDSASEAEDFDGDTDLNDQGDAEDVVNDISIASVREMLSHWSDFTQISLDKLVYTSFRKVESDVGKTKGVGDTDRVVELAGKIGGGW